MKVLELDYISKFQCDGTKCDSKCCKSDWDIEIDDATVSKYKSIALAEKSEEITKHIVQKTHYTRGMVSVMLLNENHECHFLDSDNLCRIQKTYGEDYLSAVCKTYPRLNFKIAPNVIYRALSLTCPIACHLMLNAPRTADFASYESSQEHRFGKLDLSKIDRSYMLPLLNVTNYTVLRYQELTLDERLAIVALFAESANDAKSSKELANISEIFVKEVLKNAKEILAPMRFNSANFLKEVFTFINALFTGVAKRNEAQVYVTFINNVFEISLLEDDINSLDYGKLVKIYEEKYAPAKSELFKINDLQIENFAINYLFMTALPLNVEVNDFGKNIAKFLLEYKISEFIFVCFYASMKESWHELAIELVAEDVSNCFEHNLEVKYAINDKFKDLESVAQTIQLLLDV